MKDYSAMYKQKLMTAEQIASLVQNDWRIASDLGTATPPRIYNAIFKRLKDGSLDRLKVFSSLEMYKLLLYTDPEVLAKTENGTWFATPWTRPLVERGMLDYYCSDLADVPRIIKDHFYHDLCAFTVSPMDEDGYFSLGLTGSSVYTYVETSDRVFVEVNPAMPYVPNGVKLHITDITGVCETDSPMLYAPAPGEPDEVSKKIGGYIAERIPNGATVQLGIGAIPDAVGNLLKDKRHLGIHTEMFTESMVDLIEAGAVDNLMKPIHKGYTVTTFAFGSKRLFDFCDHNTKIKILPVEQVLDPEIIAQHDNFVSINAGLEVDFFGQVCAESAGPKIISGTGGQLDFVRGAVKSKGGQSFIAFPSTAKNGTVSRIKSILTPGSVVTTGKNEVDMIVTEYGIAKMRGRSIGQRARDLIAIAHPDFREELTFEAKKRHLMI